MLFFRLRMIKNFTFFLNLLLLISPIFLSAQNDNFEHVVFEDEFKKSFHSKPKLDVKLDNRFSFIRDYGVKTFGIKVGLNFRRKFKVGLGINNMLLPVQTTYKTDVGIAIPVNLEYFY